MLFPPLPLDRSLCLEMCKENLTNKTLAEACQNLLQMAAALMDQSKGDAYTASALAYLKMAVQHRGGQGTREDSRMWLCNAVEAAVLDHTYNSIDYKQEGDAIDVDDDGVTPAEEELSPLVGKGPWNPLISYNIP